MLSVKYQLILILALLIAFLVTVVVVVVLYNDVNNDEDVRTTPLVDSKAGLISGLYADGGNYSMFLGIPYAKVDEDNPFGPSVPHPKFSSEFEAISDATICPQFQRNIVMGTPHCLNLNVYVPNSASPENRVPVMIFLHGGNFEIGHAGKDIYGPKYLVRHNVILVTVNYRLGPYGFMCLDIPEVPGNQALKDQLIALRWVKDNIEAFGGDEENITLFGESAGARSVDFHLISPQEKLFHKILMQSGTATGRHMLPDPDIEAPIKISRQIGFTTNNLAQALAFLAEANSDQVIRASYELGLSFRPCLEKNFDGVEKIIVDYPINTIDSIPKVKDMPVLLGFNDNEYVALYANQNPEYYQNLQVFTDRLKDNFDFDDNDLKEFERTVRNFYIGDEEIDAEVMWELIDFESDFTYNHPTDRTATFYLNNDATNVFYYVYAYTGDRDFFKDLNNVTVGGAAHADELGYLFDMAHYGDPSPEDQLTIDRLTMMWTNFAKYGNPTPELSNVLPVKWQPITKDLRHYMNISTEMRMEKRPFHQRMSFWNLFYEANWKLQKGYRET